MPEETAAPWGGEGLPPVGTVCEIAASTDYLTIRHPEGAKVKIYANFTDDRGVELAAFIDDAGRVAGVAIARCFRPVLTPEQIEAAERDQACRQLLKDAYQDDNAFALVQAGRLYDAGWRKQVTP
jgi:hypothetical protein